MKKAFIISVMLLLFSNANSQNSGHIKGWWVNSDVYINLDAKKVRPLEILSLWEGLIFTDTTVEVIPYITFSDMLYDFRINEFLSENNIELENTTRYKLSHNTLSIKYYNKWINFKIELLNNDSLIVTREDYFYVFVKRNYNYSPGIKINSIIYSAERGMTLTPDFDIQINSNGSVLFRADEGLDFTGFYTSKLIPFQLENILHRLYRIDLLNIEPEYSQNITDQGGDYLTIIYNDSLVKTVYDYANSGPHEFIWFSFYMYDIYERLKLKPLAQKNAFYNVNLFIDSIFTVSGKRSHIFQRSEEYLILNKLRDAVLENSLFEPLYYIPISSYEIIDGIYYKDNEVITTDGSYFTYRNKTYLVKDTFLKEYFRRIFEAKKI